jgi:hypothetical protein
MVWPAYFTDLANLYLLITQGVGGVATSDLSKDSGSVAIFRSD